MKEEHLTMRDTLERLRNEVSKIYANWTLFESSNGYPIGDRRSNLRNYVNENYESWGLVTIQKLAIHDAVLSLSRMIDHFDEKKASNRQSLGRVRHFLQKTGCIDYLVTEARGWNPGFDLEDYNENLVRKLYSEVMPRLDEGLIEKGRNLGTLRNGLKKFRNKVIAHSLEGEVKYMPQLREIRDGIVLTSVLVEKCSLLISGISWSPKLDWKSCLTRSQEFWDRYEAGFKKT